MVEAIMAILSCVLGLILGALARQLVVYLPATSVSDDVAESPPKPRFLRRYLLPVAGAIRQGRDIGWSRAGKRSLIAVDLLVAALALMNYPLSGRPFVFIISSILIADLVAIMFIDWQHHLIFPQMIYPAGALALITSFFGGSPTPAGAIGGAIIAVVLFLFMYWLARVIYHQEALGFGDVLLAGLIGVTLGYPRLMGALIVGSLLGGVIGLGMIAARLKSRRDFIPFGAYLSAATLAFLVFRDGVWKGTPFQLLADLISLSGQIIAGLFRHL
jgi:leader peptidase (prepilin peptidase) / N-methyltransferase